MAVILEHQVLELHNILCFHGNVAEDKFLSIKNNISQMLQEQGAQKAGPPITAIIGRNENVAEIEILIPVTKRIISNDEQIVFKEEFLLNNALKAMHTGNPDNLTDTFHEIYQYIENHQLQTCSNSYIVTKKMDILELEDAEIEIYIDIKSDIL